MDRVTYTDAAGSTITLVVGSPAEVVYANSNQWTEVGREAPPEPAAEEPADDDATSEEEPEATEPEPAEEGDLAEAYAAASNVGAVKALATSPERARALLDMEKAAETPRTTLLSWLADKAGPEPTEPAPEGEPSY